jgi:hypothetical protein
MKSLLTSALVIWLLTTALAASAQNSFQSSYPAANAVIYLDFDGHYLSGTSWNSGGTLVLGPANLNAAQITEVFNRVSEDYRPFNINITTDSAKYWSAPPTRRMRVVLTVTSGWYGSAGGVAYTNSFKWGDNTPCFVFTALLNHNVKNISEAASHEAGHTLGLRHQAVYNSSCVKTSEYNSGAGNGEIGWAPIMGVGYYRNWTVWHNGPNPYGCNSTQNDLDIITSASNGFGYRADDHPGDLALATPAAMANDTFRLSGIVERTSDFDLFKLNVVHTRQLRLQAVPYNVGMGNVGSNLDMQVQLLNASGQVLDTYNPGTSLNSFVDTILEAGQYFLRVDGMGNLYGSEYGSLGSYSLQGTMNDLSPLALHRLELSGQADNNRHKLNWVIDADENVVEQMIELSANGTDFRKMNTVAQSSRTYLYQPLQAGPVFYRLRVLFDNGRYAYSNTVMLRSDVTQVRPAIVGNVVQSMLHISSPYQGQYMIVDQSGRVVAKGSIKTGMNQVDMTSITRGIYLVQFHGGKESYVERFVRQ